MEPEYYIRIPEYPSWEYNNLMYTFEVVKKYDTYWEVKLIFFISGNSDDILDWHIGDVVKIYPEGLTLEPITLPEMIAYKFKGRIE
jgi:hypothetical protein